MSRKNVQHGVYEGIKGGVWLNGARAGPVLCVNHFTLLSCPCNILLSLAWQTTKAVMGGCCLLSPDCCLSQKTTWISSGLFWSPLVSSSFHPIPFAPPGQTPTQVMSPATCTHTMHLGDFDVWELDFYHSTTYMLIKHKSGYIDQEIKWTLLEEMTSVTAGNCQTR